MIEEKIQQAVGILKEKEIDLWLTFVRETGIMGDPMLPYICGVGVTWQSAFIITAAGDTVAIVGQYDVANLTEEGYYEEVSGYVESIQDELRRTIRRLDPRQIALNFHLNIATADGLSAGMYMNLLKYLEGTPYRDRIISAAPVTSALRGRKTPAEARRMREATRLTLEIFDKVSDYIRPGRSEKEIAAFMLKEVERQGLELAWDREHCPAVFTGPDTAGAHASPTDRQVAPGHLVNIDFGVRFEGYCADLQRTWYVMRPGESEPPAEVKEGFRVLKGAVDKAVAVLRPGVTGREVDGAARGHVVDNGYDPFPHGLGHQVGRAAHDGGALLGPDWEKYGETVFMPVEPGQVFTIEPRLDVPGYGIVTIEEEVWVNTEGCEYISRPQQELWLIPAS